MTDQPVYKAMMADGSLDRRHELALMRYTACRDAAHKAGWRCSSGDPTFLTAQYAFIEGNICAHVTFLLDLLTEPHDPHWTLHHYAQEMLPPDYDIDAILDAVGAFLAIDHPARYRERKRREAEMYKRWEEHPDERPASFRCGAAKKG